MEKNIKDLLNECYEMCDYIEENGVLQQKLTTSFRENLRYEFLQFVIYLSLLDGSLLASEIRFIKEYLDYDMNHMTANNLKIKNGLFESKYGQKIPLALKYFVLSDAGRKIKNDKYQYRKAKVLVDTYKELGQRYIAESDMAGNREIEVLSKYFVMLDNYLKDYGLLRADRKTKPVAKPEEGQSPQEEEKIGRAHV